MSNTITAYFKGRVGVAESVYQNDYGIVMAFDSIDLPAHFDCYFSILNQDEAVPGVGADRQVVIPNSVLSNPGLVTIHIPIHTGANDSEVEYVVYFKVIGRARPVDDGTPVQMTAIEQALALLQNPIGNIEQIVNEALAFTGETFEEMQEDLDEWKTGVEGGLTTWKGGVESDFDTLQAQFDTAVGAVTTDTEVTDIRVGADGITDTTAGASVRRQFSAVKGTLGNEITLTWKDNKFINNNGYESSDGAYACTDYVNIDGIDKLAVVTAMGNDSSRLCFYEQYYSTKRLIAGSQINLNASAPTRFELTVPDGASYFRMSFKKSLGNYATQGKAFASALYGEIAKIPKIENDIASLQNDVTKLPEYTNLVNPDKIVATGYIKADGGIELGSANYNCIEEYIRLKANKTYYFGGIDGTNYYAFYDSSFTKFDGSSFITLASVDSHYGFYGSITPTVDCYFRGSLTSGEWNTEPYISSYFNRYVAFGSVDYSVLSNENTQDIEQNADEIGNIQRLVNGSVNCKRFYNLYAVNIANGSSYFAETEDGSNFTVGYLDLYDEDKNLVASRALAQVTPASSRTYTNNSGSVIKYVGLSKGTLQNIIITYGDNIIQIIDKKIQDAQLHPTTVIADVGSKFLDGCPPKQRAVVTFLDDDGHADVYTRLYPIFHNKGQKFGAAIITGKIGTANCMTLAQLTECVESGTLETLSHTVDVSTNLLDGYTDSQIEYQLRESKAWLDEHDFNSDGFVYPQGTSDKNVRDMVRKYYMAGYATTDTWNGAEGYIDNYGIARIHLLTFTTSNPSITGVDNVDSIEYYKACVDKAVDDNLWLVFMTHIGQHDSSRDSVISSLVDYITGLGVPILSPSEAFAERRNVIDVGDSSGRHMWVGNDGYYNSFASHMFDATNATKSVGNYVKNAVTLQAISRPEGNLGGFPTRHGWLETFRSPGWEGLSMQRFTSYQDNGKVYIRFYNTSTSDWDVWLEP